MEIKLHPYFFDATDRQAVDETNERRNKEENFKYLPKYLFKYIRNEEST